MDFLATGQRRRALTVQLCAVFFCVTSALFAVGSQAAEPVADAESLAIRAVRLNDGERITLDGTLSDAAWRRAPAFDRFVEKEPHNGAQPKNVTRVQVLFDESALYVGVTALDDHPEEIRSPLVRHDGVLRTQDFIVVYLDTMGKRQSAQFFRVNAAGSLGDGMQTSADEEEDLAPDFDFDAAAARISQGYTCVFRIPFASLRFSPDTRTNWRIMVGRSVPREQSQLWMSVPIPLNAATIIAAMQPLDGLRLPEEKRFLTLRPSITVKRTRYSDPGTQDRQQTSTQGTLDVKWRPLPELVVDGTINPDFSEVALDVPQLSGNTTFSLYLPEKRPFFFESSDLLHSPFTALYTRSFTAPRWGLRSTWRGAAIAGTAFAVDDKGGGQTLLPYAYGTNAAAQPASRSMSARVLGDLDQANDMVLGGLLATREYERSRGSNTVFGPDFSWQVNKAWLLRGQWLHSDTTAQPDAQGGLSRGARTSDKAVTLSAAHRTDSSLLEFQGWDMGPGYRNDAGFTNQVGTRQIDAHQGFVFRQLGPVNELWLNFYESQTRDRINGDLVQSYYTPSISLTTASNTTWSLQYRGLSHSRVVSGGPVLAERYWRTKFSTTPATWIPLLKADLNFGQIADTAAQVVRPGGQLNIDLQTRPFSAIEFQPTIWLAWLRNDGALAYRETALQLLGVWHINARQNLRLIIQRSTYDRRAELGVAASLNANRTSSLTYTWRRSMGTLLYVGATHSRSGIETQNIARGAEVFVKLQVDVDEIRSML